MTLAGCLNRNFSGKKIVDSFEAKRVITLHHGPCLLGVIIITCCVIFNKKKENKSLRVLWIKICSLPAAKFLLTATIFAGNEINQTTTCGYGAPINNTFWFYFSKNKFFFPLKQNKINSNFLSKVAIGGRSKESEPVACVTRRSLKSRTFGRRVCVCVSDYSGSNFLLENIRLHLNLPRQ